MTRQAHALPATRPSRSLAGRLLNRALRALIVAPLLTGSVDARHVHEPQQPMKLMPAMRLVMSGATALVPAPSPGSLPAAADSGRRREHGLPTRPSVELPELSDEASESGDWREGARLRAWSGPEVGIERRSPPSPPAFVVPSLQHAASSGGRSACPGVAVPLLDRLSPERTGVILRSFGQARPTKPARTSMNRSAPKPRARTALDPNQASHDPAIQRDGGHPAPTADELEGAGHMEVHWTAADLGLSTFIGGSQEAESAHATAFGRDIGAEVGVQFMDADSRAYRFMVARSFKNDLDVPIQEAKLRFEVNVRF